MDAGFSVIYYSAPALFNMFAQSTFHKDDTDAQNIRHYAFDCDLLIIDDLGTEFTNSFIASQLFTCVNERLLNKKVHGHLNQSISGFPCRLIYGEVFFQNYKQLYYAEIDR